MEGVGLTHEDPVAGIGMWLVDSRKGKKGHRSWGIMNRDVGDMYLGW